ncbi:MAG: hypothetical protein RSD41_04905 [Kiritimatiellia bacterium]
MNKFNATLCFQIKKCTDEYRLEKKERHPLKLFDMLHAYATLSF